MRSAGSPRPTHPSLDSGPTSTDSLTRCFVSKITAWIGTAGTSDLLASASPEQLRAARQMTMALALTAARWTEYAALTPEDALPTMRRWLDQTESRAEARGAIPRADAIRLARRWLGECTDL